MLLVEGIAEALLLPIIAKHHVLKGRIDDLRYRSPSLSRSTGWIFHLREGLAHPVQ